MADEKELVAGGNLTGAKLLYAGAAVLVGVLAALLLAGGASATQTGDAYSGSGPWIMFNPTTVTGETLLVSGSIDIYGPLTISNTQIVFTVPDAVITVRGPTGSLTMTRGVGSTSVTTVDATTYFSFKVEENAGIVNVQNVTFDHAQDGLQVYGGTAASRYFAYVRMTHALGYGFHLVNSSATLFNVYISLEISMNMEVVDKWENSTITTPTREENTYFRYISRFWNVSGIGVSTLRGAPWVDGVELHVPQTDTTLLVKLIGGAVEERYYNNSYGCGDKNTYSSYYTYDNFFPRVNVRGFNATDSNFARFTNVLPPPEDFSAEIHWDLGGKYKYYEYYCGVYSDWNYNCDDCVVYGYNLIKFSEASVVGVFVQNGGLLSLTGLDYRMGKTDIGFISDWDGSTSYVNYFMRYYVQLPGEIAIYSLWSNETVVTTTAAPVTSTDFSLTNSTFTGAGVRVDRNYRYNVSAAPLGANNTVFRGTVIVDHVTVTRAAGTAINLRFNATANATFPRYDYTAVVSNSLISGTKALALSFPNMVGAASNYTAAITLRNNVLENGTWEAQMDFGAIITLDTGGHSTRRLLDTYKADVLFEGNTIRNMRGPVVGWPYGDFVFAGGSSLTFSNNTIDNTSYFYKVDSSGAKTPATPREAFVKSNVDSITFTNNRVTNLSFAYGFLGGVNGGRPDWPWDDLVICAKYYETAGDWGREDGCSWPRKTPTITVTDNTFEGTKMEPGIVNGAFVLIAGHGHVTFSRNMINESNAVWVHPFLWSYAGRRFDVEDINVMVEANVITNQTLKSVVLYTDPYRAGQPIRMIGNEYSNSRSPFYFWKIMWADVSKPDFYFADLVFRDNWFHDLTLGSEAAVRAAGKITIENNTFERIAGWAVIGEQMLKVPNFGSNVVRASTNGYWFILPQYTIIKPTPTITGMIVDVTTTAIRVENANLVLYGADFGDATAAVDMKNGVAEIYSSKIKILSGRTNGEARITAYYEVGYQLRWASADGRDSGVPVSNALVVTTASDQRILSTGRTGTDGHLAARTTEAWSMTSFGSVTLSTVSLPLKVLSEYGGITQTTLLPSLAPDEPLEYFQDEPAFPVLLVDPVIPTVSIGSPLPGSVVGSKDFDVLGYTFERGSGIARQRVKVDDGAWIPITTTGTTWTLRLTGVAEGPHTITVEAGDIATNNYFATLPFTVDVTPPSLTLLSPLEAAVLTKKPVFDVRGHVDPVDAQVALNGVSLTPNSRGDFFFNLTLADGLNILRFTAMDKARNTVVVVRSITFDRYAPFLQVDTPVAGLLTNHVKVDVVGRTERDAQVTVNGLPAFVNPLDGSFALQQLELDALFDQTENLVVIRASDHAGNVQYENRTVIVDVKAPSIELALDANVRSKIEAGLPVAATTLNVKGQTDSSDAIFTIGGQPVTLAGVSFSRLLVLREGPNVIVITSQDKAGNHGEQTLRVVRDTVKPVLTLESPAEATVLTNQSTVLVTGYTDTEGSVVMVVYTDARGIQTTDPVPTVAVGVPIQYRFEYTLVLITDGNDHVVEVQAADIAGNMDSATFTYTAKVSAPFLEIIGFKTRVTETYLWINGTTEAGIEKVSINGQDFAVVDQFFAVRWNLPIQSGNYTFTVSVRDDAGNQNVYTNRTEVQVQGLLTAPVKQASFWESPTVAVGFGAGLLGLALTVFVRAVMRRKETP